MDKIVRSTRQSSSEWPVDRQLKLVRSRDGHDIAILAEGKDGLECMTAIRQLSPHVQREVELGISCIGQPQGAAVAGVSPAKSLALIRDATASSAVTSAAFQAKRAS